MFNSGLFKDIDLEIGFFSNPLILAVNEQYRELLSFEEAFWHSREKAGVKFEDHYRPFFPPRYIERDKANAYDIITALHLACENYYIRTDLPPVCSHVMCQMILKLGPFVRLSKEYWPTDELKNYLGGMPNRSKKKIDRTDVKRWFTDLYTWLEDFQDTYSFYYSSYEQLENFGVLFLQNSNDSERVFDKLGLDLEALADIMPYDLRVRILKRIEKQKTYKPTDEDIIIKTVLSACEKISANPIDYHGMSEDALNRSIRNLLEMALERTNYIIQDQTQKGYGATLNKPGELDILIKKDGLPIAIIEGLVHKDKKRLFDHINKAIGRYNFSGCRSIVILEYVQQQAFEDIWKNTVKNVEGCLKEAREIDTTLDGIKIYKGIVETKTIHIISVCMG